MRLVSKGHGLSAEGCSRRHDGDSVPCTDRRRPLHSLHPCPPAGVLFLICAADYTHLLKGGIKW